MFICIEGSGGSGKSTLTKALVGALQTAGRKVTQMRFPTDKPIGRLLREYTTQKIELDARSLMYLFLADMIDAQADLQKALSDDGIVVCDRYFYSTMVYQARHFSMGKIATTVRMADIMIPDLVIFFDLPIELIQARLQSRGSDGDRYDEVPLDKLRAFQTGYRQALQVEATHPSKLYPITEEMPVDKMLDQLLVALRIYT